MKNDDRNIIDDFLDNFEQANKSSGYKRIYQKPSKFVAIIGFIFCLICLIILLTIFSFKGYYFFILIVDILYLVYFGLNIFTKKGFGLPKMVKCSEDEKVNEEKFEDYSDKYKV